MSDEENNLWIYRKHPVSLPSTDRFGVNMIFGTPTAPPLLVGDWVEILDKSILDGLEGAGKIAQVIHCQTRTGLSAELLLSLRGGGHKWIRSTKGVRRLADVEVLAHGLENTQPLAKADFPPLPPEEEVLKYTFTLMGTYSGPIK